jgi:class 3 adenylate cyclase
MATKFENLTILLTDIVGYTDITSQSTRDESAELLRDFNRLTQPVVSAFGGRRVKSLGDAILVTFKSPTDGVRCAMALQDTVHEHNRNQAGGIPLHIRVALSLGEIRHDNGDVFGEPVNIAARIENITPADEIYLSGAVYLAMNKAEVPSEVIGKHTFKGIPDPVSVFRVPRFKLSRLVPTEESGDDPERGFPFGGMHRRVEASNPGNPVGRAVAAILNFLKNKMTRTAWLALAGAIAALAIGLFVPFSSIPGIGKPGKSWSLLKQAETKIAASQWTDLAQLAENTLKDNLKNGEALLLKGHLAYLRDKKPAAAMRFYGDALGANPDLKTEPRMLAHLVAALQTVGQPAADLLARYPSSEASAQLADRTGKPGFAGRNRAAELLTQAGNQKLINEDRRVLLDLEEAPVCAQRRHAVLKIRERKLKQALPTLKKMTDVGFFNRLFANDPNACLLDDAKQAIAALEGVPK